MVNHDTFPPWGRLFCDHPSRLSFSSEAVGEAKNLRRSGKKRHFFIPLGFFGRVNPPSRMTAGMLLPSSLKLFHLQVKNMGYRKSIPSNRQDAIMSIRLKSNVSKNLFSKVFGDEFEKNLLQKVLLNSPYPNYALFYQKVFTLFRNPYLCRLRYRRSRLPYFCFRRFRGYR